MSTDPDKFWDSFAEDLREFKGLRPLTLKEAEEALRKIPKRAADKHEIEAIINAVSRGEIIEAEPERETSWEPAFDFNAMTEEALALYRGQGDDSDAEDVEEELRQELLNDDEPKEDDDGVGR
jgi:hypothetical protein